MRGAAVTSVVSGAVGIVLGGVVAGVALLRRAKPLHPRGEVVPARLELHGDVPELGGTLGARADVAALVRLSGGGGLPRGWPDVQGLALRWPGPGRPNDLLFSSAGLGRWTRFVLTVRRDPLGGPFTTLMPFRGPAGAVLVAAVPRDRRSLVLLHAGVTGPWRPFGRLELEQAPAGDSDVRFDPLLHCPAGLGSYRWAARLRAHPYRWARAAWPRGDLGAPVRR